MLIELNPISSRGVSLVDQMANPLLLIVADKPIPDLILKMSRGLRLVIYLVHLSFWSQSQGREAVESDPRLPRSNPGDILAKVFLMDLESSLKTLSII